MSESIIDRLDHEIRCLEAIDAGLQGLPHIDILNAEAHFAHLVQDRIDRLREISEELHGGSVGVGFPTSSAGPTSPQELIDLHDAIAREADRARGIGAGIDGLKDILDDLSVTGVSVLMDDHIDRLDSLAQRIGAYRRGQ